MLFIKSVVAILMLFVLESCKKFVEVPPPTLLLSGHSVFSNDASATSAVNGIYSKMIAENGFASGSIGSVTYLTGLSSDELDNYSNNGNQIQFYEDALLPSNPDLKSYLWTMPYQYIFAANSIIEELAVSTAITPATKRQLEGEAKFIRAFCHLYLTELFGDIPIITSTDYKLNLLASRSARQTVFAQVISDLKDAQVLLTNSYMTEEKARPNTGAATALLARAYLYSGDWENAEIESSSVITNPGYKLESDLSNVFLNSSNETIWQLKPVIPGNNTNEALYFILTEAPVLVALSEHVVQSFDPGDNRKSAWVDSITQNNSTYYFSYKYKVKSSSPATEYSVVLRLAEQYLIRAEARAQRNDFSGAISDVNIIRQRAGLPASTAANLSTVLAAIEKERQTELFCEGHRWFDLIRFGHAGPVLSAIKSGWQTTDVLYPVPQTEIQSDPNLTQNPGY